MSSTVVDQSVLRQFHRLPPHSTDAEICALGSLMLAAADKATFAEIRASLTREAFFQADNQIIFGVICDLADRQNGKVDFVLVREELIKRQLLGEVGGVEYLAKIAQAVPSYTNGPYYGGIVTEKAALRRLIELGNEVHRRAYGPNADAAEINQYVIDHAAALHATGKTPEAIAIETALHEVYEDAMGAGVPMMPFPFSFINEWLGGGVADGEFVIVAGWPSHGKSAFCNQCSDHWTAKGYPGGIISLEESRKKIARGLLSRESGVSAMSLRRGVKNQDDAAKLTAAIARLADRKLYINDQAQTLAQVVTAIDIGVVKQGWRWAIIDHCDLIDIGDTVDETTQAAKHGHLSRTIKHTARRLNIPIMAVKQLKKRGTAIRKPSPDDLRESGAYHADCDVLIFVDSDDVHHREDDNWTKSRKTDVIVSKAREGTGGIREVTWDGDNQRYKEIYPGTPDPCASEAA